MAKYTVKFSCGHEETIALVGSYKERERKIAYFEENGVCSECYRKNIEKRNSEGYKKVEMHYSEYKNNYSDCRTVKDSYNKEKKTIIVYVPEKSVAEKVEEVIEESLNTLIESGAIKEEQTGKLKRIIKNIKNSNRKIVKNEFESFLNIFGIKDEKDRELLKKTTIAKNAISEFGKTLGISKAMGYDFEAGEVR